MDLSEKDIVLLVSGFVLSIVANALWQYWNQASSRSRAKSASRDQEWAERINTYGLFPRQDAETEIIIRSFYWFVLGNLTFGIAGFAWLVDLAQPAKLAIVFAVCVAVLFFAQSLKWLRTYLRLKRPLVEVMKEADEATKRSVKVPPPAI